ncbi:unannotated protein [freshwater metagenome]|uniref:Unannotated protein n=1 Tax=freshwater metagenome TaxID=449393 RepID=A0A6J7GHQ8_9ZZZZ|nr:hypothetical protein [Actinomycetota bacterium]MSW48921.1 hypothetical protein [Actinomycetota bacterium]
MFTTSVPQTTVPPDTTEVPAVLYSVTSEAPTAMASDTSVPLAITASGTAEPRTAPAGDNAFPVWPVIAVVAILVAVFLRARKKRQNK